MLLLLQSLATILTGFIALLLIEPVTRSCSEKVRSFKAKLEADANLKPDFPVTEPPERVKPPENESATFYFRKIVNGGGLEALFYLFLLVVFLPLNTIILAQNFEFLFNRVGEHVADVPVGGFTVSVTDFHLFGLIVALAILIGGGALRTAFDRRCWWAFWGLVMLWVLPLFALEVGTAANRAYQIAVQEGLSGWQSVFFIFLSAAGAQISFIAELIGGIFGVHDFIIPALQATLWAVAAPFRVLGWCFARLVYPLRVWNERRKAWREIGRPYLPTRIGGHLDDSVFEPLRELDARTARGARSVTGFLKERLSPRPYKKEAP